MQKILIALLATALLAVSGAWGYSVWSKQQVAAKPAPVVVAKAAAKPVEKPVAAPAAVAAPPAAVEKQGGPRYVYEYVEPRNGALLPAYQLARDNDLLHRLPEVNALDGMLMLPRPLKLLTAECGQVNAFYDPGKGEVVLCYEMIDVLLHQGDRLRAANGLEDGFPAEYLLANLRFIVLHETGHALIDMLRLTATGREEDAVDQLAATVMLKLTDPGESSQQVARRLELAATWFIAGEDGVHEEGEYADEHSLGEQRYYNLVCMIYGSDPAKYLRLVTSGKLPEARAQRCPEETKRVIGAWSGLLVPHFAPKFQMTAEEAQRKVTEAERARAQNASNPYVR